MIPSLIGNIGGGGVSTVSLVDLFNLVSDFFKLVASKISSSLELVADGFLYFQEAFSKALVLPSYLTALLPSQVLALFTVLIIVAIIRFIFEVIIL